MILWWVTEPAASGSGGLPNIAVWLFRKNAAQMKDTIYGANGSALVVEV